MWYLKNLVRLFVSIVITAFLLDRAGVTPSEVNFLAQSGIAVGTTAVVIFFDNMIEGRKRNEVLDELRALRIEFTDLKQRLSEGSTDHIMGK
jgi:hypothetical protein